MTIPTLPESCSTREAAKRLKVALSTVQAWVESGHLEAWKTPGGHRRIPIESINRLLNAGMAKPEPVARRTEPRILIVEDEPPIRDLYAAHIGRWQWPVSLELVDNGYDGLVRAVADVPDLLVTDLAMPEMDGIRMIQALRKSEATAKLPIIVVTGLAQEDIDSRGGLPADVLVLFKPTDYPTLRLAMQSILWPDGPPPATS